LVGPHGTAFLCVKQGILARLEPLIVGWCDISVSVITGVSSKGGLHWIDPSISGVPRTNDAKEENDKLLGKAPNRSQPQYGVGRRLRMGNPNHQCFRNTRPMPLTVVLSLSEQLHFPVRISTTKRYATNRSHVRVLNSIAAHCLLCAMEREVFLSSFGLWQRKAEAEH
jgi:hypothetical protein